MIFVTVGATLPMDRLIKKMDLIAADYNEPVVMQIGQNGYVPKNAKSYYEMLCQKDFEDLMQQADLVISHAGMGSILDLLRHRKRCILVPRRQKYGEAINDHQVSHVEKLVKNLGGEIISDVDELEALVYHIDNISYLTPREQTIDGLILAMRKIILATGRANNHK